MLPNPIGIFIDIPGEFTGDRIRRYEDGTVELISCGDISRRVTPNPWEETPQVLIDPPVTLVQNRALKRAAKFKKKKPGKRRF